MRQNKIIFTVVGLIVVAVIVIAATQSAPKTTTSNNNANAVPKRCAEELKICPDGSTVKRVLPACDFTTCLEVDPVSALTEGWKDFTDTDSTYTIKYPPIWSAANDKSVVTLGATGVIPLTIETIADDSVLYESSNHFSMTLSGVKATQADYIDQAGTTRMIWVPRNDTFLRFAWKRTGNDAPYYQIVSTLQLK